MTAALENSPDLKTIILLKEEIRGGKAWRGEGSNEGANAWGSVVRGGNCMGKGEDARGEAGRGLLEFYDPGRFTLREESRSHD